jgi:lipoprotein NlpI
MEYLYGLILARRHNYDAAAEHFNTYLLLAPGASNAGAAREALAQLQRQAQNSTTASR